MSEHPAFVPPEPIPQGPPPLQPPSHAVAPEATVGQAPPAPPPTVYQPAYPPPVAPTKRGSRKVLLIVLVSVMGAVVLIGGLVAIAVGLGTAITSAFDPTTLPAGNPASAPEGCHTECLSQESALSLSPTAESLALIGLGPEPVAAPAEPTTIGTFADDAHGQYFLQDGTPLSCEFLLSPAPISPRNPADYTRDDGAFDLGTYAGQDATMTQVAEVYWSSVYSERFTSSLVAPLTQCSHTERTVDGALVSSDVVPATFDVPAGVSVSGWTETLAGSIRTVVDLQYINLVVRTVYTTQGSVPLSPAFGEFVTGTATAMAALSPSATTSADPGKLPGCEGHCYTIVQALSMAPTNDDLAVLHSPKHVAGAAEFAVTAGTIRDDDERGWRDGGFFPAECSFVFSLGPTSPANPGTSPGSRSDPIYDLAKLGDETVSVTQSVRLFESDAAAAAYLHDLAAGIRACPGYWSTSNDFGNTPVTPLDVHAATPSAGWQESSGGYRYMSVDLQQGNVVLRTTLYEPSRSLITEADFTDFVVVTSERFAAL